MNVINSFYKNPYALLLGRVIADYRNNLNMDVNACAKQLNISSSSLRMIEAGSIVLNVSKAYNFVETFSRFEVKMYMFSRLMVAIEVLCTGKTLAELDRRYNELLKPDEQIQSLLLKIQPHIINAANWHNDEWKPADSDLDSAVTEMKNFLSNPAYGQAVVVEEDGPDFDQDDLLLQHALEEVPSVFLDAILDTIRKFKSIGVNLFKEDSSQWEKANFLNFKELYGVVDDFNALLDYNNLKNFDYRYLWEAGFQRFNLIILNPEDKDWKSLFESKLIDIDERYGKDAVQRGFNKVTIRQVGDDAVRRQLKSQILGQRSKLDDTVQREFKICWVFVMKNGAKVGFIAEDAGVNTLYGINLDYLETRKRLVLLKDWWDKIA